MPAYLQDDPDQQKLTSHHTAFSGTSAPHVAFRLNSQVSIASCSCFLAASRSSYKTD
jgi:hypothetical protein